MRKEEFLFQLNYKLFFYVNRKERLSIVNDYAEIWDSVLADGKQEQEVGNQLGSAEKLAKEIITGSKPIKWLRLKNTLHKISALFKNTFLARIIVALPVVIGFVFFMKAKGWILWDFLWQMKDENMIEMVGDMRFVGLSATGNIMFFMGVIGSLILHCIISSIQKASSARIFILPFYVGFSFSLFRLENFLHQLSDSSFSSQLLLKCMLPVLIGGVVSFVLFLMITFSRKKDYLCKKERQKP